MTIVRFAPSPTGYLHIGNVRTALVNWLYARKAGGKFILRLDDTDPERSKEEYSIAIQEDLQWLGINWDGFERQGARLARYEEVKQKLIADGRLYPCYETPEELEVRRKMLLGRGLPPVYDRAALKLTEEQKQKLEAEGRKPHWRFKLNDEDVIWDDLVRGTQHFQGRHMSDTVVIRADGSYTYMLPSCIDDVDMKITHVFRGEDHVSNTAVQIQMFKALGAIPPTFGHMSLIKTKEGGMSKREGGFEVRALKEEGIEAMAISSLLARLGTSAPIEARPNMDELVKHFDISQFNKAPANYDLAELERVNHKLVSEQPFAAVKEQLAAWGIVGTEAEAFWMTVRGNITRLPQVKEWWALCKESIQPQVAAEDREFLTEAAALLPAGEWTGATWSAWLDQVKQKTGRKGKPLFMPIRKALTGMEHGPELAPLLPLIGREKGLRRLKGEAA